MQLLNLLPHLPHRHQLLLPHRLLNHLHHQVEKYFLYQYHHLHHQQLQRNKMNRLRLQQQLKLNHLRLQQPLNMPNRQQ
jgi:hypothetical protein